MNSKSNVKYGFLLPFVCVVIAGLLAGCGSTNTQSNPSLTPSSSLSLSAKAVTSSNQTSSMDSILYQRGQGEKLVLVFKDQNQRDHKLYAEGYTTTQDTYTLTYKLDDNQQGSIAIAAGDDLVVNDGTKACHIAEIGMVSGYSTTIYPYSNPPWT